MEPPEVGTIDPCQESDHKLRILLPAPVAQRRGCVAVDRAGVTQSWTDPEVLAIVADRGIRLVSYGDVKVGL